MTFSTRFYCFRFMDEKTKERVEKVAKALRELSISMNMQEAMQRAKEIVAAESHDGKPLKELVKEEIKVETKEATAIQKEEEHDREKLSSETQEQHGEASETVEGASEDHTESQHVQEEVKADIKEHDLRQGDLKEATKEVEDIKHAVDDTRTIIEEAEKVQEKDEEQE